MSRCTEDPCAGAGGSPFEQPQTSVGEVIAIKRGRRGRVQVVLAGQDPLEVSRETLAAHPVREGEVLGQVDLERLRAEDVRLEARSRALRFLETRERSTAEVRLRLRRYGYGEEVIERTVSHLVGLGFVDDRRFAAAYAREKRRAGWGPRRIEAELARKGVPRILLAEVLAETAGEGERWSEGEGHEYDGTAFFEAEPDLVVLVEKKFGRELRRDRQRAERRAASYLARRGHGWERIDQVLRELRARVPEGEE